MSTRPLDENAEKKWQLGQKIENDLREIIHDRIFVNEAFIDKIASIVSEFGDETYTKLMHLLCRQKFPVEIARSHWQNILSLHAELETKLAMDKPMDLRLPLVHYFLHNDSSILRPALIDLSVFDKIEKSVYQDELTSLYNFRYLKEHLDQELQRSKRYGSVVSFIMLDIDDFKFYNDNCGHEEGNQALITFAKILKNSLRPMDTAIRYGGEEFCLVLPATDKDGTLIVYERIQKSLRAANIHRADEQPNGCISVSAGVATCPGDANDEEDLIRCADNAMYTAKNNGKDQIHIYGDNRRSHQRIEAQLSGYFCIGNPDEKHSLTTIDISEGGVMSVTNKFVHPGTLLDIQIKLHGSKGYVNFPGRVLRCDDIEGDSDHYHVCLSIVEMTSQDRIRLHAFVKDQIKANE